MCGTCRDEQAAVQAAEEQEQAADERERAAMYRERASLVAFLAAQYRATLAYSDQDTPGWPVVTVQTPQGQMCWHVSVDDLDLFGHVAWGTPEPWDGHLTVEKYRRLHALTGSVCRTSPDPVPGRTG